MSDFEKLIDLLRSVYTEEGVRVWIADAAKKGLPLDEQLRRAGALVRAEGAA